jgi:hypothetical protein
MLLSARMRRLLLAALAAALVVPAPALAADPILPLAEVQVGAHCTGLSVVRGTDVSAFDVEILDVIGAERPLNARILVRLSGPAIDATGVGPGFSGSPILCTGADGIARNAGAIAETIGEYGGKTVLATPIEAMLAQPTSPAAALPAIPGARPLATPLTISGLHPALAASFVAAARKAGHVLISSPAGPRVTFAPVTLVPGSAAVVAVSSGDISVGALGTVTYVDGPNVWLFGHRMDDAGRRSLFLQDAYVHTIINNPLAVDDVATYKLASPGNDIGTVTSDGQSAVVGQMGAPPPFFPLRVTAKDLGTGRTTSSLTRIADEGDVGRPSGISPLGLAGAAAVAETAGAVLKGSPARQTGNMCVKIALREAPAKPLRFCNDYAIDGEVPNAFAGAAAGDMTSAVQLLDSFRFGTLHPTAVEVGIRARQGVSQAFITGGTASPRVRRGGRVRVRLRLLHTQTGARTTKTFFVRIPRETPRGIRTIRLVGTTADVGGNPEDPGDLSVVFEEADPGENPGPESLAELRRAVAGLHRFNGISATIGANPRREVYSNPNLRITGEARVRVRVQP